MRFSDVEYVRMTLRAEENIMKLYKYYSSFEYFEDLISNSRLYFSDVKGFNDPYEEVAVIKFKEDQRYYEILNIKNSAKICCFSENCNNYLMWSHYADKHRGICVEFEIPGINFSEEKYPYIKIKNKNVFFIKVEYKPFDKIYDSMPSSLYNEDYFEHFSHKYAIWSEEEEIRAILKSKNDLKVSIPKKYISNIILGYKCQKNKEAYRKRFLKKKKKKSKKKKKK